MQDRLLPVAVAVAEVHAATSEVRSSRFEYLSPATFLDDLVIKGRVSKWGTSSFELAWEGTVADEAGSVRDVFRG